MCQSHQEERLQINWDEPEELDDSNTPQARKDRRLRECMRPFYKWNPKTLQLEVSHRQPCRQYDRCPKCGPKKIQMEYQTLQRIKDLEGAKVQLIEVSAENDTKFARQFDKMEYRRIPQKDGTIAFIIQSDKEIEGAKIFDQADCERLAGEAIPSNNKRISGNLGIKVVACAAEEKDLIEDAFGEEITQREIDLEFDSDHPEAPRTHQEIERMVISEVEIYEQPHSIDELQYYVLLLEAKTEEICKRYGMSFNFVKTVITTVNIWEIDIKWIKYKVRPANV